MSDKQESPRNELIGKSVLDAMRLPSVMYWKGMSEGIYYVDLKTNRGYEVERHWVVSVVSEGKPLPHDDTIVAVFASHENALNGKRLYDMLIDLAVRDSKEPIYTLQRMKRNGKPYGISEELSDMGEPA